MAGTRGTGRRSPHPGDSGQPVPPSHGAPAHATTPVVPAAGRLPAWVSLVRAPNPGPMTLEGTNTWLLRPDPEPGGGTLVVDPGPEDDAHVRAVVAAAGRVAAVLVTHGHPDHVGGVPRLQQLTGAPLLDAAALTGDEPVPGLSVTAVATPGHTADSVCFLAAAAGERVVLTGDTILGRGTTVVAWPDGDLGDYLGSLVRLTDCTGLPVLPGHGPPLADCADAAGYYLAHRRARLAQVEAAVAAGATTPAEVVAEVYADVDPTLRSAAEWTVRAQLAYLQRRAEESPPTPPPLDQP